MRTVKKLIFSFILLTISLLSLWAQTTPIFATPIFASAELLKTASYSDATHVQQLLDQGADVNARDGNGNTPLILAAELSNSAAIKVLLDKGAQVNAQADDGETALISALRGSSKDADLKERVATAKLLLQRGANVQVSDARGMTPLMWAAEAPGGLLIVKWLLARGANVGVKDKRGMTALQYAAGVHDVAVQKVLRAHGGR